MTSTNAPRDRVRIRLPSKMLFRSHLTAHPIVSPLSSRTFADEESVSKDHWKSLVTKRKWAQDVTANVVVSTNSSHRHEPSPSVPPPSANRRCCCAFLTTETAVGKPTGSWYLGRVTAVPQQAEAGEGGKGGGLPFRALAL